jgi:hypothetical protein
MDQRPLRRAAAGSERCRSSSSCAPLVLLSSHGNPQLAELRRSRRNPYQFIRQPISSRPEGRGPRPVHWWAKDAARPGAWHTPLLHPGARSAPSARESPRPTADGRPLPMCPAPAAFKPGRAPPPAQPARVGRCVRCATKRRAIAHTNAGGLSQLRHSFTTPGGHTSSVSREAHGLLARNRVPKEDTR